MKSPLMHAGTLALWLLVFGLALPDIGFWALRNAPSLLLALGAGLLLITLPGLAVLHLLWPSSGIPDTQRLHGMERIGVASGIGVTLPALLLLLVETAGLRWSTLATYLYVAAGLIISLGAARGLRLRDVPASWPATLTIALLLTVFLQRMHMVRDMAGGQLGDSYQHTLVAQLLLDNGGLFSSWAPYAPLTTLTYHFGFHADAAFLNWLTELPSPRAVVVSGQIHSVLTALLAYTLAARVARLCKIPDGYAVAIGLTAAAIVGFVNLQPVNFVNWGRYTQQAGQIVLPALLICWMRLIDHAFESFRGPVTARLIGLGAIATSGMVLTHYLVTGFAILLVGAYWLASLVRVRSAAAALKQLAQSAIAIAAALLMLTPWLMTILSGYLGRNAQAFGNGQVSAARISEYSALPAVAPEFLNQYVIYLAVFGFALALLFREWRFGLLGPMTLLIVATIVPHRFGLPGTGIIDWLTGYIALYVTAAPLAAYGLIRSARFVIDRMTFLTPALTGTALAAGLLAVSIWGARWQSGVLNPGAYALLSPADLKAAAWVSQNTPANARFLINAFPSYGGTLAAGSDAGWWLPLLAGRQTTLPPLPYGSERGVGDSLAVYTSTVGMWEVLRGAPILDVAPRKVVLSSAESLAVLRRNAVTHVYIGAESAPERDGIDHIDADALRTSASFALIYERDGVLIFALK
jgi:hypothetical protein